MYQRGNPAQSTRQQAETAIEFARASRWEEAVRANRAIIKIFPNDVDSYNRLGKALMELNRYRDAKKAYKKALVLDASNRIAKKNLERLNVLAKSGDLQAQTSQVDPALFIEEMGKSVVTTLANPVAEMLTRSNAGDAVELRPQGTTLAIETPNGDRIGEAEPKLGLRLIRLMEGGNKYAAAITRLSGDECQIIIKETYQDPSQAGRPSFPTSAGPDSVRPYTKERLVRHETAPETVATGEEESKEGWEAETEGQEGHVRLTDAAAAEEAAAEEEDEE
ncbi:MAG: tetratricopeptide repeat protein [Chloroflexi bacterium]|nr:tetratricopeptide repeat protein [Chloroflexota bacterium]